MHFVITVNGVNLTAERIALSRALPLFFKSILSVECKNVEKLMFGHKVMRRVTWFLVDKALLKERIATEILFAMTSQINGDCKWKRMSEVFFMRNLRDNLTVMSALYLKCRNQSRDFNKSSRYMIAIPG